MSPVNIEDYRASVNHIDNTSNIQREIDENLAIYIPPRDKPFKCKSPLYITHKSFGIYGSGYNSMLQFTENTNGIIFNNNSGTGNGALTCRDFSITTTGKGKGTGLTINNVDNSDSDFQVFVENVIFSSNTISVATSQGWKVCMDISGTRDGTIRACDVRGAHGTSWEENNFYTDAFIKFTGDETQRMTIESNHVGFIKNVIWVPFDVEIEGLYLSKNNWVGIWNGVVIEGISGNTQLNACDNHIHCWNTAIHCGKFTQAMLSGNLLYMNGNTGPNGSKSAIYFGNGSEQNIIMGNTITGVGVARQYGGLHLDSAKKNIVANNIFVNLHHAIKIDNGGHANALSNNTYLSIQSQNPVILDSKNAIIPNTGSSYYRTEKVSLTPAIAETEKWEVVKFDGSDEDFNDLGVEYDGETHEHIIPAYVNRVDVNIHVRFQEKQPNVGDRIVTVYRNGTKITQERKAAAANTDTTLQTASFSVKKEDRIQVRVWQNSGYDLKLEEAEIGITNTTTDNVRN